MPDYCLKKKSNADKFRITLIHQFGAGDVLVKISKSLNLYTSDSVRDYQMNSTRIPPGEFNLEFQRLQVNSLGVFF